MSASLLILLSKKFATLILEVSSNFRPLTSQRKLHPKMGGLLRWCVFIASWVNLRNWVISKPKPP